MPAPAEFKKLNETIKEIYKKNSTGKIHQSGAEITVNLITYVQCIFHVNIADLETLASLCISPVNEVQK
jgi:hypothetical protein